MGKNLLKKIVISLIRWEAKQVLKKYKPKIIGITGSVGKTGTKDAIAKVLAPHFKTRASQKSFNHELGIPLTILGLENAWWSPSGWLKNIVEGFTQVLFRTDYPDWLILEVGVEQPGDIDRIISWVKFDLVVVTRLPEIPVHVEFFLEPGDVAKEKLKLARSVAASGTLILNGDDPKIVAALPELRAKVITYGFGEGVNVRGEHEHLAFSSNGEQRLPEGLTFKLEWEGNNVPFRVRGIYAPHQLYGVLAAISVGLNLGLNLVDIAESLQELEASPGRFRLLPGIKETIIIDDSYNSSPAALRAALETLGKIETSGRRIAVLGDMMELGPHTAEAHREAGEVAAANVDFLITVGIRTKFLAEAAHKKRLPKKQMLHFTDYHGVGEKLQELIGPGDVILVKGSQSIRLEHVVEEIMAQPEYKSTLLVRQDPEWQKV